MIVVIVGLTVWLAFSVSAWFAIALWWVQPSEFASVGLNLSLGNGLIFGVLCLLPPFAIGGNLFWFATLSRKAGNRFKVLDMSRVLLEGKVRV